MSSLCVRLRGKAHLFRHLHTGSAHDHRRPDCGARRRLSPGRRRRADARTAASEARQRFKAALTATDRYPQPIELATLLAAEEELDASPDDVMADVASQLDAMAEQAQRRLRLSSLLDDTAGDGADHKAQRTALCEQTLFGYWSSGRHGGSPAESGFFMGNVMTTTTCETRSSRTSCAESRASISLSLVYIGTCERLGLPMVGLNAPAHLLIAPSDTTLPFAVDAFDGGTVLTAEATELMLVTNAERSGMPLSGDLRDGARMMAELRERPMTSHAWVARMLRNLRQIHGASGDVVRTLGVAERLRLVGATRPDATSEAEQLECAMQVALCIFALRWEERRDEAREIILTHLPRVSADARVRFEALLRDSWFS